MAVLVCDNADGFSVNPLSDSFLIVRRKDARGTNQRLRLWLLDAGLSGLFPPFREKLLAGVFVLAASRLQGDELGHLAACDFENLGDIEFFQFLEVGRFLDNSREHFRSPLTEVVAKFLADSLDAKRRPVAFGLEAQPLKTCGKRRPEQRSPCHLVVPKRGPEESNKPLGFWVPGKVGSDGVEMKVHVARSTGRVAEDCKSRRHAGELLAPGPHAGNGLLDHVIECVAYGLVNDLFDFLPELVARQGPKDADAL